jgi:hypothetical protein
MNDAKKMYDKACKLEREAKTERQYKAAAKAWAQVDKGYGYFQDRIDFCNKQAELYREFEKVFK